MSNEKYITIRQLYTLDLCYLSREENNLFMEIHEKELMIERTQYEVNRLKEIKQTFESLILNRLNFKPLDNLLDQMNDEEFKKYQKLLNYMERKEYEENQERKKILEELHKDVGMIINK